MIHEASTVAWGTKADIKKTLNVLEGIDKSIADIYMTRFKGERSEIVTLIENDTWFTSNEAMDVGLADEVKEETVDSEEYKNSILARLRKKEQPAPVAASTNKNILEKFKRQQ
ncbi:ATP-dependent Clp protease proteolytic subunit [Peribacillus simplex]|uniref:ATP-dependent Clp protease proteolytic subunit n=1 Tax=Peribacillus simplex TaxID=1478 RepID=UPI0021AA7CB3|nr:ATP-dependent Clp protease proteolytic subunit [Peribacillus simplex]